MEKAPKDVSQRPEAARCVPMSLLEQYHSLGATHNLHGASHNLASEAPPSSWHTVAGLRNGKFSLSAIERQVWQGQAPMPSFSKLGASRSSSESGAGFPDPCFEGRVWSGITCLFKFSVSFLGGGGERDRTRSKIDCEEGWLLASSDAQPECCEGTSKLWYIKCISQYFLVCRAMMFFDFGLFWADWKLIQVLVVLFVFLVSLTF